MSGEDAGSWRKETSELRGGFGDERTETDVEVGMEEVGMVLSRCRREW